MNPQQNAPKTPIIPEPSPQPAPQNTQPPLIVPTQIVQPQQPVTNAADIDSLLSQGVSANTLGLTDKDGFSFKRIIKPLIIAIIAICLVISSFAIYSHFGRSKPKSSVNTSNVSTKSSDKQTETTSTEPNANSTSTSTPQTTPDESPLNANPALKQAANDCESSPFAC